VRTNPLPSGPGLPARASRLKSVVYYSPSADVFAVRNGDSLAVRGDHVDADLTGSLADEFLAAFLSPGDARSRPDPSSADTAFEAGRLAALAAIGSAEHQALADTARRAGGLPWTPLDAISGPSVLFLEVVGRCNERCVHCYADSSPQNAAALDRDTCLRVIREGAALGFEWLQLTGGDPLLCPFLEELVLAGKSSGFRGVEVYTNGLALDARRVAKLAMGGAAFAFSFYSHDASTHDAITRVPGSQARTRAAIAAAVAAGCEVRVSIILMSANADHLEPTRALIESLGVAASAIGVDSVREVGRGLGHGVTLGPSRSWPGTHASRQIARATAAPGIRSAGKLCVSYSGQVYPCIFARFLPLGDVSRESLGAIVSRTQKVHAARTDGIDTLHQKLACLDCQLTAFALGA
jgi:MoaA/NifB/PqqE/SkfB family radical SAM enzyme